MDSRRQAIKLPENLDYILEHGRGKQSASAGRNSWAEQELAVEATETGQLSVCNTDLTKAARRQHHKCWLWPIKQRMALSQHLHNERGTHNTEAGKEKNREDNQGIVHRTLMLPWATGKPTELSEKVKWSFWKVYQRQLENHRKFFYYNPLIPGTSPLFRNWHSQ